jgi:tRNA uridine 5-carboxymethylaminomethyl modification enzyme
LRLTEKGREVGLVDDRRWQEFTALRAEIEQERSRLESVSVAPAEPVQALLRELGTSELTTGVTAAQLLKRPVVRYEHLVRLGIGRADVDWAVREETETQIKYEGYIQKELAQVERMRRMESRRIPEQVDYSELRGLSNEGREKLEGVRPETVGQASRISGVSPADISVLLVYLEQSRGVVR